ncbi:MAG: transglutaminase family protein [Synergistaceae bacterium]|nr:transglutaminase family protein [Synergistaceae bacterium]
MLKENGDNNENSKIESAAVLKNVSNEAKRRPDLLASLIMSWLDEDMKAKK